MVMGDFNAHTANLSGNIPIFHENILSKFDFDIPQTPHPTTGIPRPPITMAKNFCADRNLTILNGCTPGDSQGHFTYEKGNIRSVIDYCTTSPSLFPLVRYFQIGLHNSILSDHSILITRIKCPTTTPPPPPTNPSQPPDPYYVLTGHQKHRKDSRLNSRNHTSNFNFKFWKPASQFPTPT